MGIDPGVSGAVAFYFRNNPHGVSVDDVPVAGGQIDPVALAALIKKFAPDMAMIELVHAMPKQGVSSCFNFGMAFGSVRGVIGALQIPLHLVTPGKWKKHFLLSADKEDARALAIRLFPASAFQFSRKKDHGRAEACLIARYAADAIIGGGQ
jgi:crossover junction endodeoxyribonuclease RuvC